MESLTTLPGPMAAADPYVASACRPPEVVHAGQKLITVAIVAGPALALGVLIPWLWGSAVDLSDLMIAVPFYLITGFGITIGFHRLFTHRAFGPQPGAQDRAGRHGIDGGGGVADQLGGDPPAPPPVQRPLRRPPFPPPLRRPRRRPVAGAGLLPCRMALRLGRVERRPLCARHAARPRPATHRPALPGPGRGVGGDPLRHRLPPVGHPGRGPHRAAVGGPRPDGAAPPRHLVGQFAVPHLRPAVGRERPTGAPTCGRWPPCPSATAGTTSTMPTRAGPATGHGGAWSTRRRGSSAGSSSWDGRPRSAGRSCPTPAGPPDPECRAPSAQPGAGAGAGARRRSGGTVVGGRRRGGRSANS